MFTFIPERYNGAYFGAFQVNKYQRNETTKTKQNKKQQPEKEMELLVVIDSTMTTF